jgi:hypothetical protein
MSREQETANDEDTAQADNVTDLTDLFRPLFDPAEESLVPVASSAFDFFGLAGEETGPLETEQGGVPAPPRRRGPSLNRRVYTLDEANEIAEALRALPAKDPSQRRLDKQAVIRHIVDEIKALQERGYTLEEVARILTAKDVELTTPTLKSYLQRARHALKRARKSPGRTLPL